MKLDELSSGTVYVDTNVLYMYLRVDPVHLPTIRAFLGRVVRGVITAFVSVPVLDAWFYRLLLARVKDATGRNPLDVLREDLLGAIAAHSNGIAMALRQFMALPYLALAGVETRDFNAMLNNIEAFSLLPRDALHVAIIRRLGLTAVASDDTDFDRVDGLERHWVMNPPHPRTANRCC